MKIPRTRKSKLFYKGKIFDVVQNELQIDGIKMTRDIVKHPGAVVIIPFLGRSRILFAKQYRHAVKKSLIELPAGTLEPKERPLDCARRELIEEVGYRAHSMRRIGMCYPAPGYSDEKLQFFLARNLTPETAAGDADEFIEPKIMTLKEAFKGIYTGRICDAKSIVGLLLARQLMLSFRRCNTA